MNITKKRKVTLKDLAKEANMAVSTVSMALADNPSVSTKTKNNLQRISRKLGYKKTTYPYNGKIHNIATVKRFGLVLVGDSLQDEANIAMLHSLSKTANSHNVRIEFSAIENIDVDDNDVLDHVLSFSKDLKGLLFSDFIRPSVLNKICEMGISCVVLGNVIADISELIFQKFMIVTVDLIQMGMLATKYLIEKGNHRIGFICEVMPKGLDIDRWFAGYQLAHQRKGLAIDPKLIQIAGKIFAGGESAATAISALDNKPTAYVIPDIRIAASFIQAMRSRGIEIPYNSVVMGGEAHVAKTYHLENYPLVCGNNSRIAECGFENLIRLSEKNNEYGSTILVPFTTYNIS